MVASEWGSSRANCNERKGRDLGREFRHRSCSQMKFIAAKIFIGAAWEGAEGEEKKTISETNREGGQKCPRGALLHALSPLLSSL